MDDGGRKKRVCTDDGDRLKTIKAASKDILQSVPFIVQYESRNNQVHFLAAKVGIISDISKYFCNFL